MQVEHKTEKGTVLFLKVTDSDKNFKITKLSENDPEDYLYLESENEFSKLLPGNWKLIGLTSEVTEEQLNKIFTPKIGMLYEIFSHHYLTSNVRKKFKFLMQHLKINEYEKWIVLFKPNENES